MSNGQTNINWSYDGKADYLLGNGASQVEQLLAWIAALAGFGLYVYFYFTHAFDWSLWQYLLAGIIAFDVIGGIVANSLNSCKRFYHLSIKPGESSLLKNHFVFTTLHIYPLLIAVLYDTFNYFYGAFWYAFLIVSTLIILKTPLYLKRPAAFLAIALALLINLYFVTPVHGFEWFMPALFMKIVYGHLVQEEPYRPVAEKSTFS